MERRTLVLVGVLALVVLLALGVVIVVRGQQVSRLENELAEEKTRTDSPASEVASDVPDDDETSDEVGAEDDSPEAPDATSREFAFVREIRFEDGAALVIVDYAQFLTGDKAAAAAAAAGDESPPPNDYYILNENPQLRTFTMSSDTEVTLVTTVDGLIGDPYTVTADEWAAMIVANDPPNITAVPYWISISGGALLVVEEQYIP